MTETIPMPAAGPWRDVAEDYHELPLVVGRGVTLWYPVTLQECGHTVPRATAGPWESGPTRRRCQKCAKGHPRDVVPGVC